jgi:phage terminase large subunit
MLWPGSTTIIFRKTRPEVKANHVIKFLGEVPHYRRRLYSFNAQDLVVTWANGSRTYFGYLEHDKDVFNYQGPEYDVMIFEEATHQTWWRVNWLLSNRLRATVDTATPFALFPSNPGNVGHFWYKRLFIERRHRENERPEEYAFLQAKVYDNYELCRRDPGYVHKLEGLEEPWRSWMLDGNFHAGQGTALQMRKEHLCDPFKIPQHWTIFGGYDWGFAHPAVFGLYAVEPDRDGEKGRIIKLETISMQYQNDWQQIRTVLERGNRIMTAIGRGPLLEELEYVATGADTRAKKAFGQGEQPSSAERWQDAGFPMSDQKVDDRVPGLNNLRDYLRIRADGRPGYQMFNTASNVKTFEQLEAMVQDPDDLEDVLKVDADEVGEGGDDRYDETRMALMSRPCTYEQQQRVERKRKTFEEQLWDEATRDPQAPSEEDDAAPFSDSIYGDVVDEA